MNDTYICAGGRQGEREGLHTCPKECLLSDHVRIRVVEITDDVR